MEFLEGEVVAVFFMRPHSLIEFRREELTKKTKGKKSDGVRSNREQSGRETFQFPSLIHHLSLSNSPVNRLTEVMMMMMK
jgi:hypothetical protein